MKVRDWVNPAPGVLTPVEDRPMKVIDFEVSLVVFADDDEQALAAGSKFIEMLLDYSDGEGLNAIDSELYELGASYVAMEV